MNPAVDEAQKKAKEKYDAAFHLLAVTYPSLKDPKVLLGVASNLSLALEGAMDAVLLADRQQQIVPNYGNTFLSKYSAFCQHSVFNHRLAKDHVKLILDLHEIVDLHQKSPVEFPRGDTFVICDKDFETRSITVKDLQEKMDKTKAFLEKVNGTINPPLKAP